MLLTFRKSSDIIRHTGIRRTDIIHQDETHIATDKRRVHIADCLTPCGKVTLPMHGRFRAMVNITVMIARNHETLIRQRIDNPHRLREQGLIVIDQIPKKNAHVKVTAPSQFPINRPPRITHLRRIVNLRVTDQRHTQDTTAGLPVSTTIGTRKTHAPHQDTGQCQCKRQQYVFQRLISCHTSTKRKEPATGTWPIHNKQINYFAVE